MPMLQPIRENPILNEVVDIPCPVEEQEEHDNSAAELMPMDKLLVRGAEDDEKWRIASSHG